MVPVGEVLPVTPSALFVFLATTLLGLWGWLLYVRRLCRQNRLEDERRAAEHQRNCWHETADRLQDECWERFDQIMKLRRELERRKRDGGS